MFRVEISVSVFGNEKGCLEHAFMIQLANLRALPTVQQERVRKTHWRQQRALIVAFRFKNRRKEAAARWLNVCVLCVGGGGGKGTCSQG